MDKRLTLLSQHGFRIPEPNGDTYETDCIFCSKESHFYFTLTTDGNGIGDVQWTCHRCGLNGNKYELLSQLVEQGIELTTDEQLLSFEQYKGLPAGSLEENGCYINWITDQLCLPMFNQKGKLANVYIYDKEDNTILGTAILKRHILGISELQDSQTLYIVEGHWDYICLKHIIDQEGYGADVLGLPGAASFTKDQLPLVKGKDVCIILDNDHPKRKNGRTIQPGKDGTDKIIKLCTNSNQKPKSIRRIEWDSELSDGYDIRDVCVDLEVHVDPTSYNDVIEFLNENLVHDNAIKTTVATDVDPIESFDELCDIFREHLMFSDAMKDTLAAMVASIVSFQLPDQSVCLWVVGPPSCGKSTLCEAFTEVPQTLHQTKFTGLVSGWETEDGSDNSIFAKLSQKCLIVKDFTTILALPHMVQANIFGDLRDATDGSFRASFRNSIGERNYDRLSFSVVAGVTDEIRAIDNAPHGARFLSVEIVEHNASTTDRTQTHQALSNLITNSNDTDSDSDRRRVQDYLRPYVSSFMEFVFNSTQPKSSITSEHQELITDFAEYIAYMRTSVKRNRYGNLEFPVRKESSSRVAIQLAKIYLSLARFIDDKEYILSIIKRIALDTVGRLGYRSRVLWYIHNHTTQEHNHKPIGQHNRLIGTAKDDIAEGTNISKSTVSRIIKDFAEIGITEQNATRAADGTRGRHSHEFILTQSVSDICSHMEW